MILRLLIWPGSRSIDIDKRYAANAADGHRNEGRPDADTGDLNPLAPTRSFRDIPTFARD
jgi:hypothetical protein